MKDYKVTEPKIEKSIQEIEATLENEKDIEPVSLSELMKTEFPEAKWIVQDLIPVEGIVALSGAPASYKTWFILDLAIKVAEGKPLFDQFETKQCSVLFIDEETGAQWIQKRIAKLSSNFDIPIQLFSQTGFKLSDKTIPRLLYLIEKYEIGVIIFDSLVRINTAKDENSSLEIEDKVGRLFRKLTNAGVTVIFTHHHRKLGHLQKSNPSQDMRGSGDILALVDSHIALERKKESVVVTQAKSRHNQELKPFSLNFITEDERFRLEFAGDVDVFQDKKVVITEAIKELLTREGKAMNKSEICEALRASKIDGGESTYKKVIKEMCENEELFTQRGKKNAMYCWVKPFEENQTAIEVVE